MSQSQVFTIKSISAQHKISEEETLKTLKAAGIVQKDETLQKIGDRKFSDEAMVGFNIIRDYFKSNLVQKDNWDEAAKLFQKHQSDKANTAKHALTENASPSTASKLTPNGSKSSSALTIQQQSDLAQRLAEQLGETNVSQEQMNYYVQLILEISEKSDISNPLEILAIAYNIVRKNILNISVNCMTTAVLSRPTDCTADEVLARAHQLRESEKKQT